MGCPAGDEMGSREGGGLLGRGREGGGLDLRGQEPGGCECWPGIKRNQRPKRQVGVPVYMEASLAADGVVRGEKSRERCTKARQKHAMSDRALGENRRIGERASRIQERRMGRKDGGPAKQADDVKRNDAKVGSYRRRQTELATRGRDVWENWRLEAGGR